MQMQKKVQTAQWKTWPDIQAWTTQVKCKPKVKENCYLNSVVAIASFRPAGS